MGTKCNSAKEINTSSPHNVSSMNDTIKFNQIESNEGQKNDSFNQILDNINEYQIENSKQFSDENNSIYTNNNDNSNVNNNTDNIDQRVKNDIENSYNIADDIRSSFTSNSLIEHGAVLNDNNSFFNNDEILYATDKLIEIHEEFQKDKQVLDFKSKMENLKTNKKKKDDNNDENIIKTKKVSLIGESKDDEISNTRIRNSTILEMNNNLFEKKSERKRQSVFTDMNSLKNYFNQYTIKKNLTMRKKKSPNKYNDEVKSISLVPMKKSITLNSKVNQNESNSKKQDLNNGLNKNNNNLNKKDEDKTIEDNNNNNKKVKKNIDNKLGKVKNSNLQFKFEDDGLGEIKSNSTKNLMIINPDNNIVNDEVIKRREKKLLSCKPEYKEGILFFLNQKNLLNPNINEENKDKKPIKSNNNTLNFEEENKDIPKKSNNNLLNIKEENKDNIQKKNNKNFLNIEEDNINKKPKKSNKNILNFEEENLKPKKSNRNSLNIEDDNHEKKSKKNNNNLLIEDENLKPKKSNKNILNIEEVYNNIHKSLNNNKILIKKPEEDIESNLKKNNKNLIKINTKEENQTKKSSEHLIKINLHENKEINTINNNLKNINKNEENNEVKPKAKNINLLNPNIEEDNKNKKTRKSILKKSSQEENKEKKEEKNDKKIKIPLEEEKKSKKSNKSLKEIKLNKEDNFQIPQIQLNNEMIKFSSSSDDSEQKVNNENEDNESSSSSSSSSSSIFNENFSDEKKHYNINEMRKQHFDKETDLKRKLSIIEEDKKEDLLNSLRKITEKSSYSESRKDEETRSINEKNLLKLNSFKEKNSTQNDKNKIITHDISENIEFTENYDAKSINNKKKEEEFIASIPLQIKEIPKKKDLFTENRDSLTDLLKAIKEKEKVQYKNNTIMDLQRYKSDKIVSSYLKKKNDETFKKINDELKQKISDNNIKYNNNEIKLIEIKDNFEEINPEFLDKQNNNYENIKAQKSNVEEENDSKKNNKSQNNKSNNEENEEESDKSDEIQIPNINNEIFINKDFNENKNIKEEIKDENNLNEKKEETIKEFFSESNEESKSEKDLVKENKQFNKKIINDNNTVKELSNEESKSEKEFSHVNNNSLKEKENETKKENNQNTNIKEDKNNYELFTPKTNNILINTNDDKNIPKLQNFINNIKIPKIESSSKNLDKNATVKKQLNSEIMKIKINFAEDSENINPKNSKNNKPSNLKKNSLQREVTYTFSNNKLNKPDIKEFKKSLTMSNNDENNVLIGQTSPLREDEKYKKNINQNSNKTNIKTNKIINEFVKKNEIELDYNDLVNEKYKRKFSHLIDSNVYSIDFQPDNKSIPTLNLNNPNYNNNINYNPLKTDGSVLLTACQSNNPNYTIIKNTELTFLNSPKKNDSINEMNNQALSVIQPLSAFHNNKMYQNLNDKISVNSDRKIIFNQTITNFQRNQEFTIINTPVKQKKIYQLKYKFYDWEKNKQRIKNTINNKTYIEIENEKNEKTKRQFFFGLIIYSELKKVIDITDKIIYSDKFCTLTNYEFNVYKNLSEFITLQKPYITIQRANIKNASRINISNKTDNKGEPLIYFGIKYHNTLNNKTEVLFFASEYEKLVAKWINILNREIEE